MAKTKKTKVGDKPGVTRGKQWVSIDKDVELLDMPGILWPKFDDQTAAQRLAFTGAIKDDVMDTEALARALGEVLREKYPGASERALQAVRASRDILTDIAKARGMLVSGGVPDTERAAATFLDEYRGGRIGRITLELPAK